MDKLTAMVKAVNRANAVANDLCAKMRDVFAPLVGQQLDKATGGFLQRVSKLIPELPSGPMLHVFRHRSEYMLAWTVKTCEHDTPNTVIYYEVTVYVGNMRNGALTELCPSAFSGRTDYTTEEVTQKRAAFKQAQKAFEDARDALYPFGEYDR